MVGQSMINVRSGGRSRLSTLSGGVFLLVLILVFGDLVAMIPMAALVAVMVVVAAATFDWSSLRWSTIRSTPKTETSVMAVTVETVLLTHNLAYGVLAGVVLASIFFARRVAHVAAVTSVLDPEGGVRIYAITGELFVASTNELVHSFDCHEDVTRVVIDSPMPTSGTRRRSRASTRSCVGSTHVGSRPRSSGSTSTAGRCTPDSPVAGAH